MLRSRWIRGALWLGLFLPLTALLLAGQLGQRVDPTNRALKIPGSRDAENMEALARIVPDDAAILLAFAVPGGLPILPVDREQLEACRASIEREPGVTACRSLPGSDADLALFAVSLRSDGIGNTELLVKLFGYFASRFGRFAFGNDYGKRLVPHSEPVGVFM
jgi:hypothetical protein